MEGEVVESSTYKYRYLFDTFIVLLNLSTSYSLIPYLVFRNFDRYKNMIILIIVNLLYMAFRFNKKDDHQDDRLPKRGNALILLYVAINLSCLFSGFITDTGWKSTLVYLFLNVEFYCILCKLFDDYTDRFSIHDSLYLVTRGYLILVFLSLFGCLVVFIYIKMGGNPSQNPIGTRYDLFYDNAVNFGASYCFPLNLCVVDVSPDIRIPFFQEAGLLTGLYHEPHCMTFMIFPALFLLLYYSNSFLKKTIWILLFLFVILISGSTTNIASVLITLAVYMFYTFKNSLTKSILLLVLLSVIVLIVYLNVDFTTFNFIFDKIEGGSKDYSMSTIGFALHPKSLFGTSFYNLAYVNSSSAAQTMDVGWVTFILNGFFLIACLLRLLFLFRSDSTYSLAVLLFAVYFFCHSAKVAMVSYSLTMLVFVCFIINEAIRTSNNLSTSDE